MSGKLELTQNDIKLHTISRKGKKYKLIEPNHVDEDARKRNTKKEKSYEFWLKLENVQESDSGVYVCLARNKYGSDYRMSLVHVNSVKGKIFERRETWF